MNSEERILELIRATKKRAWRETYACLFILVFFGWRLHQSVVGTLDHDGCVVLLVAAVSITLVVWMFALGPGLLRHHPTSDLPFWKGRFQMQARLLRWVPVWYLAPLAAGLILRLVPLALKDRAAFIVEISVIALLFAYVWRLNWSAANKIEAVGRTLEQ